MSTLQVASKCSVAAGMVALISVVLIALVRADEPSTGTGTPQAEGPAANPEMKRDEAERIRQFVHQLDDIRKLMPQRIAVEHLAGHSYVAKVMYARAHRWRLYLVQPLKGNPGAYITSAIGVAAGERGVESCMLVLLWEQGGPDAKVDYGPIVQQSVQALSADYGVAVGQNADIPGYDKAPLAADLAGVIRPMWTYASKGARGEKVTHYVTYTYQQIAGQVFRHEFQFSERRNSVATVRLATGVGDVLLLE